MTNEEYGKIIGKNLKRIMFEQDKRQTDVARDLGISPSTLSGWMNATRIPKMDKVDMLCQYFNCKRSDLMEPHEYYTDPSAAKAAQSLYDSELRALLDAAKGCKPENIRKVTEILKALKETNPNG